MARRSRTFRVFVSSTFADLKEERNALQAKTFRRLRELCMNHGCRFQAIDLRWGVSEEAGRDHRAMEICLAEIKRCQEVTPKPNFVVLLGDRYGWKPLPSKIPAAEFEEILSAIPDGEDKRLLSWVEGEMGEKTDKRIGWYRKDLNALPEGPHGPAGEYCLRPREVHVPDKATPEERLRLEKLEQDEWQGTLDRKGLEAQLRDILIAAIDRLGWASDDPRRFKYEASATHQEIMAGALSSAVPDAQEHVFGFFRNIVNLDAKSAVNLRSLETDLDKKIPDKNKEARHFIETLMDGQGKAKIDQETHSKLIALKRNLKANLPGNTERYQAQWTGQGVSTDHLQRLCDDVYDRLSKIILSEIEEIEAEQEDKGNLELEIEAHEAFAEERRKFFTGREDFLQTIENYLESDDPHPLAIWGESGTGKSALMAQAWSIARGEYGENTNIVLRMIGATPESSGGRALLQSLCQQLSRAYSADASDIPLEYRDLVEDFPKRLALATSQKRLILFIDALDQLSDLDHARSLKWLPEELPLNVRVVVSTLPGDPGECKDALEAKAMPATNLLDLKPMPLSQGEILLNRWLDEPPCRALQPEQRQEVMTEFKRCGLPLYLRVAFEEARLWHSYDGVPDLGTDVPGILNNLFDRLSEPTNHGELLVSRAMGYLRCAKNGLTEDEMVEVLSSDMTVYKWFLESGQHLPPDLLELAKDKLMGGKKPDPEQEKSIDDTAAEAWLKNLIDGQQAETFLKDVLGCENGPRLPVVLWSRLYHDLEPYLTERAADETSLLDFYHRQVGEAVDREFLQDGSKQERHVGLAKYFMSKPFWVGKGKDKSPNLRKTSELPFQQAHGGMWRDYEHTLTRFDFLRAKMLGFGPQPLIEDFDLWSEPDLPPVAGLVDEKSLGLIQGAIRLSAHILENDSPQLPSQLYGRLLLSDAPAVKDVLGQLEDWDEEPWLRPLVPILAQAGGPLLRTLVGHNDELTSVSVIDGRMAVTGGKDRTLKVWNLETGKCLKTLKGHSHHVTAVRVTSDGSHAVSASKDKTVKVWNLASGECLTTLEGHTSEVTAVTLTQDGRQAVSGSDDTTIKVWDLETGKCLKTLKGHTEPLKSVSVTPDGRCAVSGSEDRSLKIWNLHKAEPIKSLDLGAWVNSVSVTPDGSRVLSAGGGITRSDNTVKVWDLETGECLQALEGHNGPVKSVSVTPDGHRAISGSDDTTIKVWDLESGKCLKTLEGHGEPVKSVSVTPDGHRVISGSEDKTVKLWDLESRQRSMRAEGHGAVVN